MNRRDFLATFAATAVYGSLAPTEGESTLYAQGVQAALMRGHSHVEFLVLQGASRTMLACNFADSRGLIAPGSLLKPFLADAFLRQSPALPLAPVCRGLEDRCWKPGGHGALSLPEAIAQSCNAYFLALAGAIRPGAIRQPSPPPRDAKPEDLIGLTPAWQVSPWQLVDGYAALLRSPQTSRQIMQGMHLAASDGTAHRIGVQAGDVLAKTGTAPCISQPQQSCVASGDGLVFAAVPASKPNLFLLVRQRGTTGASAAITAGTLLTQLRILRAF